MINCPYTDEEIRQQIHELIGVHPPKKMTREELIQECKDLSINLPTLDKEDENE